MSVLGQYEPREALHYFEEICGIPHGSGNVKQISDYLMKFAKEHGLEAYQDELYNVIMIKEATSGFEDVEPIILQGHMDMVCEKTLDSTIDFEKDGLDLHTDGEWIWADKTTLGGDDGIAVAYAMAILASDSIEHPRLEAVFTVDEEIGLLGAEAVDLSMLKGRKMINIDSEEEGIILTSCAGGLRLQGTIPVSCETYTGQSYKIALTGMLGGHSGCEIQNEHANSNQMMGRVLYEISRKVPVRIAVMAGGSKDNAIPRHTEATVLVEEKDKDIFAKALKEQSEILGKEYSSSDPDIKATLEEQGEKTVNVLTNLSQDMVLNALMNLPNGVQAWSMDVKGLVETSLNLGIMNLDGQKLFVCYAIRSSIETAKKYLTDRTAAMIESMGGSCETSGDYPGWEYRKDSELRDTFVKVYTEMFGAAPQVQAIHAGLECGLLSDKIENLDAVSIGPDMMDVHTYTERLNIPSTKRTWDLLVKVIGTK
ncbi:aminoacyl-histidine dipeptidase [Hespellia stercorisuis]|uniref:Cytosol non-specific dipeptidase n=1 Tax=Hespellia stercorisuis DSM 15480 TaxID=1121950 RepID=A0A1M6II29_9FIRM|nr:aminoacyl-histidine dipeptidase [Hespellia stercorisuis]SHJ34112.1 dipeptidase D [Hespellia stercorisuis DSM 15480]